MIRRGVVLALACVTVIVAPAAAQPSLPAGFKSQTITSPDGADIFVRFGGAGPVVVLLHGYGNTGVMWGPLAAELARTHTVIVPDLRGMGASSRPAGGYDKKTEARDIRAVVTTLGFDRAAVVGHDIGTMVAYAYAAQFPDKVERLVVMDAPLPGIDPWDEIVKNRALWHFGFGGPDAERLVLGRERIYLDHIWNSFAGDPAKFDEASRAYYAVQYAQPGAMRAGFAQFAAFQQDAIDNKAFQRTPLTMPVMAIGGEKSFGAVQAENLRQVATNVRQEVVPGAGHWLMEESPALTVALVSGFVRESESGATAGTSGAAGLRTEVIRGDPAAPGPYTIRLHVPAHTRIAAHDHPDDRTAVVVSGTWYFGLGDVFDAAKLTALRPGSRYAEPPRKTHFAETRGEPVVVEISGIGPSATRYVNPALDPRKRVP